VRRREKRGWRWGGWEGWDENGERNGVACKRERREQEVGEGGEIEKY